MKRLAYSKPFLIVAFLRQNHRDLNSRLCSFRGADAERLDIACVNPASTMLGGR